MNKTLCTLMVLIFSLSGLNGQKTDMSLFSGMKPRNVGPGGMSGRVTAFAADPRNENVFFVGTASGGLWKTVNAGTTFIPLFDNEDVASIGALAVDPLRPDIIWAGTGEGNPRNSVTGGYGIYKSIDGGLTWKCMGLELTRYIHRIIVDPANPDIVYAGAIGNPWAPHRERGLFRTRDGGVTWQQVLYVNETTGVADMVMDPSNPGKIFVAMWDHQRKPWFFTSSPEGSGLWLTRDGGETFTKLTNGLPAVTGRMGLAIAASNPDYVYAYVESKPSAIYRSSDGGNTWQKRGDQNIGNRPFYYAEIYADPGNENRLYTLYSNVNVSEDGGLTFGSGITSSVHSDHHAWWIDPLNPDRILDGNDGGMAISYDKGKTWRHIENLPLGQFYHISVDDQTPYNIYGGLQDNGSWRGPAYTWYNGPVINEMFEFLIGGDGFDAMPVPGDPAYCYAQSQGGALRRVNTVTGWTKNIRPVAEPGEKLRFNWNSALAQDPFENNTIYFGSQFVHRSSDRGDSWSRISPDLTTNDPEKQKQDQSGGITLDITGAENHCTILSISPSPVQKGVIWAGTDDGCINVSTDGGQKWENMALNIKGIPRNSWVPQITASPYAAGTAFAVVNDYRQGDNSAYLYRTDNYGKTWKRIIDDTDVRGYVLCFVQDPKEQRLMFAGTEYGLYVSFDEGDTWNRWQNGYPTVSTYDMAIHPREGDLVIGTFGRALWVLDDINPLRALAHEGKPLLDKRLVLFDSPEAVTAELKNLPGYYFYGDAMFRGENRKPGAMITFYSSADTGNVRLTISDDSGKRVREIIINPVKGFNRISWAYDHDPLPRAALPQQQGASDDPRSRFSRDFSFRALPGNYKITAVTGDLSAEAALILRPDPRMEAPDAKEIKLNMLRADSVAAAVKKLNESLKYLASMKEIVAKQEELFKATGAFADEVREAQKTVRDVITNIENELNARPAGILTVINSYRDLSLMRGAPTADEERTVKAAEDAVVKATNMIEAFIAGEWARYNQIIEKFSMAGRTADR